MFDAMPDNAQGSDAPEPEARPPVSPPVQETAPALEAPSAPLPSDEQLALEARAREALHGFGLAPGGRGTMTNTAERIGNAVGSAQREVRRRLELVRRPGQNSPAVVIDVAERANQIAREGVDRAGRMMAGIEEEVSGARREAAKKLDDLSEEAGQRFQQLRRQTRDMAARAREWTHDFADAYPLQTIAIVAGFAFAVGVTLRLRRSHHG